MIISFQSDGSYEDSFGITTQDFASVCEGIDIRQDDLNMVEGIKHIAMASRMFNMGNYGIVFPIQYLPMLEGAFHHSVDNTLTRPEKDCLAVIRHYSEEDPKKTLQKVAMHFNYSSPYEDVASPFVNAIKEIAYKNRLFWHLDTSPTTNTIEFKIYPTNRGADYSDPSKLVSAQVVTKEGEDSYRVLSNYTIRY